jgi:hypothetical protein
VEDLKDTGVVATKIKDISPLCVEIPLTTKRTAKPRSESTRPRMLYSRDEAAYQLCISPRALDYLISKKELAVRRVGKKILIPHGELVRFAHKDHDSVAPD